MRSSHHRSLEPSWSSEFFRHSAAGESRFSRIRTEYRSPIKNLRPFFYPFSRISAMIGNQNSSGLDIKTVAINGKRIRNNRYRFRGRRDLSNLVVRISLTPGVFQRRISLGPALAPTPESAKIF